VLTPKTSFLKGIKNDTLKGLYRERADSINWEDKDSIILGISQMLLDIPSQFGGKEEGIVIKYKTKNTIIKFQQEYQVDQDARRKIKAKYKGTPEEEVQYWDNVYKVVDDIMKKVPKNDLHKALQYVASYLKTYKPTFGHIKKDSDMIKEDIQLSAKMMISKKIPGSNGALILGKFRVFTIAHYNMIKEASAKYDTVTVAIISGKDTKGTKQLRNDVVESCLSKFGNIEIINASTGNISSILNKTANNINTIIAGSDRVEGYKKAIERNKGMDVYEIKRTDSDVSATKVIAGLENYKYFQKNTPECSWKFYDKYLEVYK
jgi:nicotinamide mononucleotide adenylyltransferase